MRLISPITLTEAMVVSDVPMTDYDMWAAGTTYNVGDKVIQGVKTYECLIQNSGSSPELNISGTTPKWLYLGYTNRWKMFDAVVGSRTIQANSITVSLTPGTTFDSIAFIDVIGNTIDISVNDPVEGEIYTETIDLVSKTNVNSWYTYFFEPIITDDAAVLLGIPPYGAATVTITITATGYNAEIGSLVLGTQRTIGATQRNPTIGITDYSRKDTDSFGNYTVVERAFSKRMSCDLWLLNSAVDDVQKILASYRATPVVWVGADAGYSSMIIYGFYKSFQINIAYIEHSICSIEIEGLV